MSDLKFEEAMEELESVVNNLENGNLKLDESIDNFKKGMELSKYCNDILEKAEKEITVLIQNENGEMIEENFDSIEE